MANPVRIVITSSNGTKQTFDAIASDANMMASSIEQSGARSAASYEKLGNAIGKIGLAVGGLSLLASKANADAEASQARLSASIEATGATFDDYASRIQDAANAGLQLGFDDEDLQNSISQLIQATGDVGKSITDMGLAEDIARGRGIALADAARIVGLAEQGRTGTLIRLGIQIDKNATKEQAIAALQGRYAGQAEAYSKTTAASWDRVKNSIENAAESAGSHLASVQLPIIALSSSAAALGPLIGALKEIEVEGTLLEGALGPVGLAAAALAAGAGILYLLTRTHEFTSAAAAATGETQNLTNFFLSLADTLDPVRAQAILVFNDNLNKFVADAAKRQDDLAQITDLETQFETVKASGGEMKLTIDDLTDGFAGLTQEQLRFLDTSKDGILTIDEASAALASYQANVDRLDSGQVKTVQEDITKIFSQSTVDYQKATDGINKWEAQLQAGIITGQQFVDYLTNAAADQTVFGRAFGTNTAAIAANTVAVTTNGQAIANQMAVYAAQNQSLGQSIDFNTQNAAATVASTAAIVDDTTARRENAQAIVGQMNTYADQNQSLQAHTKIWVDMVTWANAWQTASDFSKSSSSLNLVADAIGSLGAETKNAAPDTKEYSTYLDDQAQSAANAAKAIDDYRGRLQEVHMVVNDGANQFAKHATVAGNALDAGFRVAVGNTNAIASQSQGVEDWADKLIGVKGTIAEIDTLLAKGVITADEYNRAQSAETSILHNNAAIQRDVLKIQTDQAPLLARLTANERDYMDELAKQPAAQQLVTLGYMDQAESAKALADVQLAASAVAGELGKTGTETAEKMIRASAEADPVLAAMLQDMGLITLGADGTVTVHFESVDGAKSSTDKLIGAVRHMSSDLEKLIKILIDDSEVGFADGKVNDLKEHVNNLDGSSATVSVGADTSDYYAAISGIGLGQIIGDAFVHVGAIVDPSVSGTSSGEPPIGGTGGQSSLGFNGGVMGYAGGGAVSATLAEYGGELVHLAGGGAAYARHKGLYDLPRGSYVDTAPMSRQLMPLGGDSFHFDFSGATFGGNKDEIVRAVSDAIVMAANRHFAGHGVRG